MYSLLAPDIAEDAHLRVVAAVIPEVISMCKLAVEHTTSETIIVLCQSLEELPIIEVANEEFDEDIEELRIQALRALGSNAAHANVLEYVAWRIAHITYLCTAAEDNELAFSLLPLVSDALKVAIRASIESGHEVRAAEAHIALENGDLTMESGPRNFLPNCLEGGDMERLQMA